MAAVTVKDLVVRFDAATILDRVSVSVASGELLMLLGPSGCGKTTLLRIDRRASSSRDAGSIRFDDEEMREPPPHDAQRRHGVPELRAVAAHDRRRERRLRPARAPACRRPRSRRASRRRWRRRAWPATATAIDELSGGEQQRVALARALVVEPRCLLLDEPLSNLDAKLRQSMREEIRRLCKSAGLTTIYVTHDQKEALADRRPHRRDADGADLQIGTPTEVYRAARDRARSPRSSARPTCCRAGSRTRRPAAGPRLDSPIGPLVAAPDQTFAPAAGSDVWVSIRPECLRAATSRAASANVLRGRQAATAASCTSARSPSASCASATCR